MSKLFDFFRPKIYKDIVFICICVVWIIGNIVEYHIMDECFFWNNFMVIIMCVVILIKLYNTKFNNWLNTQINIYDRKL